MSKEEKEDKQVRLDKYLWSIRVFKTRSLAGDAISANRVRWNGNPVKASRTVHIGDRYEIKASERKWDIEVTGLLQNRKAFSEAVNFYVDHTSEEDKTSIKMQAPSFHTGKRLSKIGRPTKKDRRALGDLLDNEEEDQNE